MFFDNPICFILNHDFYVIILYDSFLCYHSLCITCSSSLEEKKLIGIVNCTRFFEFIYDVFQVWSDFMKVFLDLQDFISIIIAFIFNIIAAMKVTYSDWFVIIFFLSKKVLDMSNYSVLDFFIFLFQSKKISYIFSYVVF